jgi:hypothetical protein
MGKKLTKRGRECKIPTFNVANSIILNSKMVKTLIQITKFS